VVVPTEMVIVAGVTTSESLAGELTFKVAVPTVIPSQLVALMIVEHMPTVVALPELSIVATLVLLLLQVTWLETSKSLAPPAANVKWPAATYACVTFGPKVVSEGDTEIELSWSTASGSLADETFINVALMFVVPSPIPVASPVLLICATDVLEEFQVAVLLTSFVVLSLKSAVAAYCKEPQAAVTGGGRAAGVLTAPECRAAPRTAPAGAALT
jgi:hypothetical protein